MAEKDKRPKVKRIKTIEGVNALVRITQVDVDGYKKIRNAITGVKGIGKTLARAIIFVTGINGEEMAGKLDADSIKKLEDAIMNPTKYGIPVYMLNRRKDRETGKDGHLTGSDLIFRKKQDIDFMRKIRCYKGIRHEQGLPVRGQRTRGNFRKGTRMGVIKNKALRSKAAGEKK